MISVENVSLTIGNAQILRDISVSFEEGQIHGIIGRNGSGKTMLMKCMFHPSHRRAYHRGRKHGGPGRGLPAEPGAVD